MTARSLLVVVSSAVATAAGLPMVHFAAAWAYGHVDMGGQPILALVPLPVALDLPCLQGVVVVKVSPTGTSRILGTLVALSSLLFNVFVLAVTSWTLY